MLISEAKKRGYKNGDYKCLTCFGTDYIADENEYVYEHEVNQLWQGKSVFNKIYEKGNWAEIIPTMTIEEAEKKLNCRIIK